MDYKVRLKKIRDDKYKLIINFDDINLSPSELQNFLRGGPHYNEHLLLKYHDEMGFYICFASVIEIRHYDSSWEKPIIFLPSGDWLNSINGGFTFNMYISDEDLNRVINIVSEINYYYNYIFKVIKLDPDKFTYENYLKHREKMIKEEKSRVKIKFTETKMEIIKFKYNLKEREGIYGILKYKLKHLLTNSNIIELLAYIKEPSLNSFTMNNYEKVIKDSLIESIWEFEEEKEFEYGL